MSDPRPYLTPGWKALRARVLEEEPVCRACHRALATHCDHIRPHRGDPLLFWDRANLQGLCRSCHSSKTNVRDGGWGRTPSGRPVPGTALTGEPTDPEHPWHR